MISLDNVSKGYSAACCSRTSRCGCPASGSASSARTAPASRRCSRSSRRRGARSGTIARAARPLASATCRRRSCAPGGDGLGARHRARRAAGSPSSSAISPPARRARRGAGPAEQERLARASPRRTPLYEELGGHDREARAKRDPRRARLPPRRRGAPARLLLGRLRHARRARAPAHRPAGRAAARRADQPPRPRVGALAAGVPRALPGDRWW